MLFDCISHPFSEWLWWIYLKLLIRHVTPVVLLCSGNAAIPIWPAEDSGNAAVPPSLPDWSSRAETNGGGWALLRVHGWPCKIQTLHHHAIKENMVQKVTKLYYVCGQYAPSVTAVIEILSDKVQIYSSHLYIHAHFTGIRYVEWMLRLVFNHFLL